MLRAESTSSAIIAGCAKFKVSLTLEIVEIFRWIHVKIIR